MTAELTWARWARHDLGRLDRQAADRAIAAMTRYAATGAGDVRPLAGRPEWRLLFITRTEGAIRTIEVLRVLPRGRAYRGS